MPDTAVSQASASVSPPAAVLNRASKPPAQKRTRTTAMVITAAAEPVAQPAQQVLRPSAFLAAVIEAVSPLVDDAEGGLKEGLGNKDVATALKSVAGHFTVADAAMVVDALDDATVRSDFGSTECSALTHTYFALRDFLFFARPCSLPDVAARETYLGRTRFIPKDVRPLLFETLRLDIMAMLDKDFSTGDCFGGSQPALNTEEWNEVPWWKWQEKQLASQKD